MINNESAIPTPENWHWAITPEDVVKIKNNDRETVNKVYFDNYNKFFRIAKKFVYKHNCRDLVLDCCYQIYIDLLDYDYTNLKTLFRGIRYSCRRVFLEIRYNKNNLSLDATIEKEKSDSLTLLARIKSNGFADLERREREKAVLKMIVEQTNLTDGERDILIAVAFNCAIYKGIFKNEYRRANP